MCQQMDNIKEIDMPGNAQPTKAESRTNNLNRPITSSKK